MRHSAGLSGLGQLASPGGKVVTINTGLGSIADNGSGGNYALSAARALADTELSAEEIARKAMAIAADICVYTNGNLTVETLDAD